MTDNLPPGLDHSHPYFHEDPDLPCVCGHARDEHEGDSGPCTVAFASDTLPEDLPCDCTAYEPDEEAPPR